MLYYLAVAIIECNYLVNVF